MLAMDNNDAIMLVLLDLSAAFDTIDHAILLQRVHDEFGIHGTALSWLQSYLQGRSQCVKIQRTLSPATELHFGAPQGSVLGPVLFTLYTAPIGRVVRLEPMFYADDSQLYITFRPAVPGDEVAMVDRITASLSDIRRWMLANMLQLNDNKTECQIICSPRLRSTIQTDSISMGEALMVPAAGARNLGVLFDNHLDLERHIKKTCQVAYHHLRNISAIRACWPGRQLRPSSMPSSHHAWISATAYWLVSLKFNWNASNVYRMLQQDCWLGPKSTTILLLYYKNFTGC